MEPRLLHTASEAIEVLGGNRRVMDLTGARKTTVWWWKKNNRFPSRYYLTISTALHGAGYAADAAMFGLVEPEAAHA